MTKIAIFVIVFLPIIFLSCCYDNGNGAVQGTFSISDCHLDDADVDLHVDYFAAAYFENTLSIRLQHTTQYQLFADGLYLEIRDIASVAENLGEPIQITLVPSLAEFMQNGPSTESGDDTGYPATPYNSPARATLYLYGTCPDSQVGFTDGQGTITFTHVYQPDKSNRIAGSFELEFIDPRTWKSEDDAGDRAVISGDFDFSYTAKIPEQPFS